MSSLDEWAVIADPDPDPCWQHRNIRVKGFVGEVDLPTDQYIRRPIEHIFQDACKQARVMGLPDGGTLERQAFPTDPAVVLEPHPVDVDDEYCAHIVEVKAIDDYGSMLFKFKFWGVPER